MAYGARCLPHVGEFAELIGLVPLRVRPLTSPVARLPKRIPLFESRSNPAAIDRVKPLSL